MAKYKQKRPADWQPKPDEKQRLLAFEGFGPDDPDVVFIGIEEHCASERNKQRDNIWVRCTSDVYAVPRADKDIALEALKGMVKTKVPVWDFMAKIMGHLTGRAEPVERAALGSRPAKHRPSSWLTELRPFPQPHGKFNWEESYLKEWFTQDFSKKADYLRRPTAIGPRVRRALDRENAPRVAFVYGAEPRRWAESCLLDLLEADAAAVGAWEKVVLPTLPVDEGNERAIQIGRTRRDTVLVLSNFFDGRYSTALVEGDLPTVVASLQKYLGEQLLRDLAKESKSP